MWHRTPIPLHSGLSSHETVIPCLPQNVQPIWWEAERRQFQTHHVVSLKAGKEDGAEWSRSWKKLGRESLGSALGSEMCSDTFTWHKNCTADGDLLTALGLFQALTFLQGYSMASWSLWVMLYLCVREWCDVHNTVLDYCFAVVVYGKLS